MKNAISLCISIALALGLVDLTAAQTPGQPAAKPGQAMKEMRPEKIAQNKADCIAKATTDQGKAACEQAAQAALNRIAQRTAREKAACMKRATTDQGKAACEARFAAPAPATPAPAASTTPPPTGSTGTAPK